MSKSVTHGLLAFAVLSSLALAQEPTGGWSAKAGSGLKYDGGDSFGLSLAGQLQTHYTFVAAEDAPDTSSFTIRRARITMEGHAFNKNVEYKLQLDGVDDGTTSTNGAIKEGHIQYYFLNHDDYRIGLRMGQGKTQFGLEGTGSSKGLFFVERSSATRALGDTYSRGAWLVGKAMESKLRWVLGAMNTEASNGLGTAVTDRGEEASNSDNELSYVLTANFDPLGDFFDGKQTCEGLRQGDWRKDAGELRGTIGVGVALGNARVGTQDLEATALNINTAWSINNLQFMGEYFTRTDDLQGGNDKETAKGWFAQGTYLLPKDGDSAIQWGFGLRVNLMENDAGDNGTVNFLTGMQGIGSTEGKAREVSVVADAFYHGHACKTQIEYTNQEVDPDGGSKTTNHIFRLGFQILF